MNKTVLKTIGATDLDFVSAYAKRLAYGTDISNDLALLSANGCDLATYNLLRSYSHLVPANTIKALSSQFSNYAKGNYEGKDYLLALNSILAQQIVDKDEILSAKQYYEYMLTVCKTQKRLGFAAYNRAYALAVQAKEEYENLPAVKALDIWKAKTYTYARKAKDGVAMCVLAEVYDKAGNISVRNSLRKRAFHMLERASRNEIQNLYFAKLSLIADRKNAAARQYAKQTANENYLTIASQNEKVI